MRIVRVGGYLAAGLLAATLSAGPAAAVQLNFDLNDGQISLGTPMTVNPGESLEIWIDFFDAQTGLKQHLKIEDDGNDPPLENFGVSISGTDIANGAPDFRVELTGVMGDLDVGPVFTSDFGDCFDNTGNNDTCVSSVFPGDLTDTSFFFHDIHITFTPPSGQIGPATIEFVQFGFAVNTDQESEIIGVWPMPEPGALALFGFGLLGLAVMSRRNRQPRPVRSE